MSLERSTAPWHRTRYSGAGSGVWLDTDEAPWEQGGLDVQPEGSTTRKPSPDHRGTRGGLDLLLASLAALVAACGTGAVPVSSGGNQARSQSSAVPFADTGSQLGAELGAQVITFTVVGAAQGAVGLDGKRHDTFRATSSTTVTVGRPVTLRASRRVRCLSALSCARPRWSNADAAPAQTSVGARVMPRRVRRVRRDAALPHRA